MILIFDSHPVQYKAPIYQRLEQLRPGSFRVIYATDATMRGHADRDFGTAVTWNTPLLEGYAYTVLHNENGTPLQGFKSLSGRGVFALLRRERPAAVLISQFLYAFDQTAYLGCRMLGIPIWIRHETQDEAFVRSAGKSALRNLFYRVAYGGVEHAFYIGELSREHLRRHGVAEERMSRAAYCTPHESDESRLMKWRALVREELKVGAEEVVVLFSGKFIDKKNPELVFQAFQQLAREEQGKFRLLFVGSGPLEEKLQALAAQFPGRVNFTGFVNQAEIPQYYSAADILVLPSRRAGETWGLVVNEALQSGCGVIVSKAAGCYREFGGWERVRVIEDGDAAGCAAAMRELARFPRSFTWCSEAMKAYSVDAAAEAIAREIDRVS